MDKTYEIKKTYNYVKSLGVTFDFSSVCKYLSENTNCNEEDLQTAWEILNPSNKDSLTLPEFTQVYNSFLEIVESLKEESALPRSSSLKKLQSLNKVGQMKDHFNDEGEKGLLEQLQDKNRLLEIAAVREQSLKEQLNIKTLQLQALKEDLLTKSKELGKPPPDSPKDRALNRARTSSMSDVVSPNRSPTQEVREFHNKVGNLEKIEREIGEKSKTLALLNKQLFRRSGSQTFDLEELQQGLQSSQSFPENYRSPTSTPPRSPSPAFGVTTSDAVFTELQEVRALRDKLQGQLVKRREDNEILQQQVFDMQSELIKKVKEISKLEEDLVEERQGTLSLQELLSQAKAELEEKTITMTQTLDDMKKSQVELQGAQLKLNGPIASKLDELQVQLFNSQNANVDLQLQVDQLNSELDKARAASQSLEGKIIALENAKSDLERKSILVVADSKQFSTQLEEVTKHHETELDVMHAELQKVVKELTEERKGRRKAEQQLQEAEDEVNAFRKEKAARRRADSGIDTVDEDPFTHLLQKARERSSILEDTVSALQAQIHTLQNESRSLRTEIDVLQAQESAGSVKVNGTQSEKRHRQRREKLSETESRIMEVEMRLKRQLSLSELGNLAKMAETELINSRLSAKIGELESALRHATEAAAKADEERASIVAKMDDSDKIIRQITSKLHDTEEQLRDARRGLGGGQEDLVDELEMKLREATAKVTKHETRIRDLESALGRGMDQEKVDAYETKIRDSAARVRELEAQLYDSTAQVEALTKDREGLEDKISGLQASLENFEVEFEEQKQSLIQEANLLRERMEMEKRNYEEYSNKMDSMLEDEKKAKQTIVENFANKLQDDLRAAEENLTYTQQQLSEQVTAFEEGQDKLQERGGELETAKSVLEETKQKLWSAEERTEELGQELEDAKAEIESIRDELSTTKSELEGSRAALSSANDQIRKLRQLNDQKDVVVARIGEMEKDLKEKVNENLRLSEQVAELGNSKTEIQNLKAEIAAQKSILEAKQSAIENLENDLKAQAKSYSTLEKTNDRAMALRSKLEADLAQSSKALEDLDHHKQELEAALALEKKSVDDLRQENALLASHVESKTGDVGDLVLQVSKLTEQLHSKEKTASDLSSELKRETSSRLEAESQAKKLSEKIVEMESNSSHLSSELTQQLSHLRGESDLKAKTIASLEANLENVSSHLSQTRAQIDELTKTSSEKSEIIAELKGQISSLQMQLEKDKIGMEAVSKSLQDRNDSITTLQTDLARSTTEVETLGKAVREKATALSELERKLADTNTAVETANLEVQHFSQQLEQRSAVILEKEAKIAELNSKAEEERRNAQRGAGELGEKVAILEGQVATLTIDLDSEKRARVADEEKHKVTVNSLVIIIEDIFKRLKWELEGTKHNLPPHISSPDLAAYWAQPPNKEIVPDMTARKATIDEAIKQLKTNRIERKMEVERLKDVAQLLEQEKLVRTKIEQERSHAVMELEQKTSRIKALELEQEAREAQLGQQLTNRNPEEGLSVVVNYVESVLSKKDSNLTHAIRNILQESQLRSKDLCDLRVEVTSKTAELEQKAAELATKSKELASKTRELTVAEGSCQELAVQLSKVKQQFEDAQKGVVQHAKEEMDSLSGFLDKKSAELSRLESENIYLEAEKARLEAEKKGVEERLQQKLEERKQMLEVLGIKESGVELVKEVVGMKSKLEAEVRVQSDMRVDLEMKTKELVAEIGHLRTDLDKEKHEKESALTRAGPLQTIPQATARRGVTQDIVVSSAPGSALAAAPPQSPVRPTIPIAFPMVSPARTAPNLGVPHTPIGMQAATQSGFGKRTFAVGGFGLGQVLKTFMTDHHAVPEDLEIVENVSGREGIMGRSRSNSSVSGISSVSSRSSGIVDEDPPVVIPDDLDIE